MNGIRMLKISLAISQSCSHHVVIKIPSKAKKAQTWVFQASNIEALTLHAGKIAWILNNHSRVLRAKSNLTTLQLRIFPEPLSPRLPKGKVFSPLESLPALLSPSKYGSKLAVLKNT